MIWLINCSFKMMSFIGYTNNTLIKLSIYFKSHLHIVNILLTSFQSEFMFSCWTVMHTNIKMLILFFTCNLFPEIILKRYDIDFCIMWFSVTLVTLKFDDFTVPYFVVQKTWQMQVLQLRYLMPLSTIFQIYWRRKPLTCRKSLTNFIT